MDSERLSGIAVNDIISGIAASTPGAGVIGGYCEDGFPFFHANRAMIDMLGYNDEDDLVAGIGGLVANTIHPDDMPQVTADLGDFHHEGVTYETTYRMPRKDGSWFWTVDRGEVIRAQDGRLAIISVCQDMTAFVHRQQELERRSLASESMLGSLPGGYHRCAADEGYPFIYTSERFRDMLGWSEEELEAEFDNKFLNLVHPDDRKITVEYVHELESHKGDRYQDSVYRLLCKGRGYCWFTDSTLECEADGTRFFQGFLSDITPYVAEREQREDELRRAKAEADRANAAKTSFLRRMSHDIRTPLNGIMGMVEISRRYADDPNKRSECRKKILDAANYLASLVDDILDTTKLESGTVVLEERPFDLLEVLDEIIAMVEPQAAEAGVEFTSGRGSYTIPHRHLVGSPAHLNRILANLVTNAVKYNRPGGTVHSSIEELSCDGETITYRFVCADTGIGMSKEFQARAFELFARENRDASVTGTGLGLAIVKELAELMGGAVRLESEEGAGSTFTVDIPFKLDLASDEGQAPEPSPEQVDLRGRRALLVEDNDLNLEIALMMLQDMGLDCDVARNGKEAVEVFAASEDGFYDLVFMDVMMPVMNGLDAARSIRALGGDYARGVVILAMTANAFADDVRASLDAGMNGHITKPLDRAVIEDAVAAAMG